MIQWFLNYPRGTAVSRFIDLGSNDEYLSALAHIENRVYHRDHIPLNDNTIIIHRADGNYYEHGKGDIMRKPFIALVSVPKQVGDYDDIRSLYHELTHTLEDIRLDQRDGEVMDGSERRAYFLQFMADVAFHLADMERTGNPLRLGSAMTAMSNAFYVEEVIGAATIRQDAETFGAKCTLTSHELFEYYATAYDGPQAEAVRDAVLRLYFPGNVTKAEGVQIINKNDSVFVEEDGFFKGVSGCSDGAPANLAGWRLSTLTTPQRFRSGDGCRRRAWPCPWSLFWKTGDQNARIGFRWSWMPAGSAPSGYSSLESRISRPPGEPRSTPVRESCSV